MDKQDELEELRAELRRTKQEFIGLSTFLHYLLHRLGGCVTINREAALDAYQEFDVNYRVDSALKGQITLYLKPHPVRP